MLPKAEISCALPFKWDNLFQFFSYSKVSLHCFQHQLLKIKRKNLKLCGMS
jgi:hypothetical protein